MDINVQISDISLLDDVLSFSGVSGVYVEFERIRADRLKDIRARIHAAGKKFYLALPFIFSQAFESDFLKCLDTVRTYIPDGFLVRNLDELGLLPDKGLTGRRILDAGMYSWNTAAMKQLRGLGADTFTAPYELNKHELAERGLERTEVVIYGYYPVMIAQNCLRLTQGKCVKEKEPYCFGKLRDRTGAQLRTLNCCRYCYNIIYNSVPTWLMDEQTLYGGESVRIMLTCEPRLEAKAILSKFFDGELAPSGNITRGHYNRGAD